MVKQALSTFWQLFEKIGLLFIPTSGRPADCIKLFILDLQVEVKVVVARHLSLEKTILFGRDKGQVGQFCFLFVPSCHSYWRICDWVAKWSQHLLGKVTYFKCLWMFFSESNRVKVTVCLWLGSGCGSVGRLVASDTRYPRSSPSIGKVLSTNCT